MSPYLILYKCVVGVRRAMALTMRNLFKKFIKNRNIHFKIEFEAHSWRGVLDTTLWDNVCQ
jgi:hypothetical protein